MKPIITLHKISLSDVDTYVNLEKNFSSLKNYSPSDTIAQAQEQIKNNLCFFIKQNNIIVGSIDYHMKDEYCAYITGLVVHPDFQDQGIARTALNMLLEELKNVKEISLDTHPHNTKAIMLYLSSGFLIDSWKDNYYGDGEPRIVLRRKNDFL